MNHRPYLFIMLLVFLLIACGPVNRPGNPGEPAPRGSYSERLSNEPVAIGYDNRGNRLDLVFRHGRPVTREVAVALDQLVAAAARDGVSITLSSGFRSRQEQDALIARYGLFSEGGLAARNSCHTNGVCVDLLDSRGGAWLRAHAADFGFVATIPEAEPWHHQLMANSAGRVLARGGF